MASNLNSEFNYRYQVIGSTPWEKLKTLQNFLTGRKSAAKLQECSALRYQSKLEELDYLKKLPALPHIILNLQADLLEMESLLENERHAFELNKREIEILEKLIAELYVKLEPTRIEGYTDDMMFEANANYEFTISIGREIQAELIANGRPSPAKLLNAMSNPQTLEALKLVGLVPEETILLDSNDVALQFTLQDKSCINKKLE
jgi:hypothetical protein